MPGKNLHCWSRRGRGRHGVVGHWRRRRRLVFHDFLIYFHNDVRRGRVVALCCRCPCLLGFEFMSLRFELNSAARVIIVLALALLRGVATGARGRDLALAFILAIALLLLELLRDDVDLGEARRLVDLVWSEKRFVHSDVCETCFIEGAYGTQDLFYTGTEAAYTRQVIFLRTLR